MLFVLTWIFTGWLSMDDSTLFSTDRPSDKEIAAVGGAPDWNMIPRDEAQHLDPQTIEAEWFAFGGHIYRRQINPSGARRLAIADASADPAIRQRAFLDGEAIDAAARRLAPACAPAVSVKRYDIYATSLGQSEARIFRVICGDVWFDVDAANGTIRDRLDKRQRVYRWLFSTLHRLDFSGFCRPTGAADLPHRCALRLRLRFQSHRCRFGVAKNSPIAKRSWLMCQMFPVD
jgi:hypothetical protein